jgi:S-(hydroxymethyl)glutathione dehydrogenase/alcohol dehydrogenase
MRTRAAVLREIGRPLEIEELTVAELLPGQVLVRIAFSGVCHTQLNEVRGLKGPDRFVPHTLGHEASGTVVEVGAGVGKVRPGDLVVLSWLKGSGADVPSARYADARGSAVNSGAISTFMELAVVSENRVTVLPAGVALREAALLGCAIPTGAGVVLNAMDLKAGDSIAVFGMGGVGLSAVLMSRALGARIIVGVDVQPSRLELASKLGATHVVDARSTDAVRAIREITENRGVDFALEAAGLRTTMEQALASVRDAGGHAVIAGNLAAGERISIDPFDLIRGKRITGTWGGESQPDRDIPRFAQLAVDSAVPLGHLISAEYRLDAINEALDALDGRTVGRALVAL